MMFFPDNARVYFVLGATDMRKGIGGLSQTVAAVQLNVFEMASIFVFCSKNKKTVKVLYWDGNGFCLFQKKLETDKFQWPSSSEKTYNLHMRELNWLLDGLNPVSNMGYKNLNYSTIN